VRKALGTLPWVEQASLQFDFKQQEVRFNLKDKAAFDEEAVKKALAGQRFPEVTVKSAPKR
jgi:hypothetical protein